ncbi:MAG TPA: hypothetical protein VKH42_11595 [Vicinamibacterales bacterium]|nr:hypothetical protein [Vicinamibacterales bacterium]
MTSDDESPQRAFTRFRAICRDWRALVETRANVLVQGRRATLDQFLDSVRPVLRQPVAMIECGPDMSLHRAPTVVLANVDRLCDAEQRALHAWAIDAREAHAQLITLSSVALFRLVKAKTFDRDLYYRLNTILVQLERL